jgi:hypothetical protein
MQFTMNSIDKNSNISMNSEVNHIETPDFTMEEINLLELSFPDN